MNLNLKLTKAPAGVQPAIDSKEFGAEGGVIGRAESNDWVLSDPEKYLSSRHCRIACEDGCFYLVDISTNGTFVNGSSEPLGRDNRVALNDGDSFEIGDYSFQVALASADPFSASPFDAPAAAAPAEAFGGGNDDGWGQPLPGGPAQSVGGLDDFSKAFEPHDAPADSLAADPAASLPDKGADPFGSPTPSNDYFDNLPGSQGDNANPGQMAVEWPETQNDGSLIPEDWLGGASSGAAPDPFAQPGGHEPSAFGKEPSAFGKEPSAFGGEPSAFGKEPSQGQAPNPSQQAANPNQQAQVPRPGGGAFPGQPAADQTGGYGGQPQQDAAGQNPFAEGGANPAQAQPAAFNQPGQQGFDPSQSTPGAVPPPNAQQWQNNPQQPGGAYGQPVPGAQGYQQNPQMPQGQPGQGGFPPGMPPENTQGFAIPAEAYQQQMHQANQQPPGAQAPGAQPPPRGAGPSVELLQAMGLSAQNLNAQKAAEMDAVIGEVVRETIGGLMQILRSRTSIKNEFRMNVTTIQPVENNPIKFSASVDEVLDIMFVRDTKAYKEPVAAVRESFQSIADHQVAILAGIRSAFKSVMDRFNPEALEAKFERQGKNSGSLIPGMQKAKYWNAYEDHYQEMVDNMENSFQDLFGEEFVQAYEEQLRKIAIARKLDS